jgi:hypothetical protein
MIERIDSTLKALSDLKTGLSFFQNPFDKIKSELEEIKSLHLANNPEQVANANPQSALFSNSEKKNPIVRRADSEDAPAEKPTQYNIQVVGLGVEKVDF